jgi:hypothetical protein
MKYDPSAQQVRRDTWYRLTRERIGEVLNPDGTGRIPQFEPPFREPVWILPALYSGPQETIDLANRMVARYLDPAKFRAASNRERTGKEFGIFQSNSFAHCLHRFGPALTSAARKVMTWHTRQVFKTYRGAGQPDFKFHGANDNMPMMATKGLILGGEALGNRAAVAHGVWNLNQFRRLLSRSAWASEFNSSTYSAVTISAAAKIATFSADVAVRELARDIEHRLWAEILLHYHPGTLHQAGPQSRAYCIDYAGHNHAVQLLLWAVFGPEVTGRDLVASYFAPDGREVIHFAGNPWQSIAEFCEMLDADLHVPAELAPLIARRKYPAILRGRSECMGRFDGAAAVYHTETYMEKEFSLGTVGGPLCGGEQTASLYATYRRRSPVKTYRDAATVFFRYLTANAEPGAMERSEDGGHAGEKFISSQGWCYALQKKNVGLLLCTPNLKNAPLTTDTLKLSLLFPAHFGRLGRCLGGGGSAVEPVSVEAGEVFIHVQPLLPTNLPRRAAVRLALSSGKSASSALRPPHSALPYESLDLVNYEGPLRTFSRRELGMVLNGLVLTVSAKRKWPSLKQFHQAMSDARITDYFYANHRFVLFQRADVEFDVTLTTDPFGVQTEGVDGRQVPRPIFESNQIEVQKLPFMRGDVARNAPFFPWGRQLEAWPYPDSPWLIGSRGLPNEANYRRRVEALKKPR